MNVSSDRRPGEQADAHVTSMLNNRPQDAPRGSRRLRWLSVATDAAAVAIAVQLALLPSFGWGDAPTLQTRLGAGGVLVCLNVFAFVLNKLYLARTSSVRALENAALLRATVLATIVALAVRVNVTPELRFRRVVFVQICSFVAVLIGRHVFRSMLRRARRRGRFMRPVVLVGAGDEAFELLKILRDDPELGFDVRGIVGSLKDELPPLVDGSFQDVPYLGNTNSVVEAVRAAGAQHAIIGATALDFKELNRTVRALMSAGVHIQISGGLAGISANRLRRAPIGREASFYLEQVSLEGWQAGVKRAMDIVIGSVLLLIASPIIAILAFVVRRHDGGPAFFKQKRIGLDGMPFEIVKVRTMVVDAEARLASLLAQNERSGPLFKLARDPRLTPIGRLMDATSLNELPQLWNVIRGDMSLVGPRPALPREVATFDERLMLRHLVRPGITGLWQVESRDSPSFADYERCDVFYVENWSVQLDLAILLQTVGAVMQRALSLFRPDNEVLPSDAVVVSVDSVVSVVSSTHETHADIIQLPSRTA